MKKIYRQHLAPIFILCVATIIASCTSFPLVVSPTSTPECIGDTWSYDENVQTIIDIDPDLTINISRMGSWGFCPRTLKIHGDGSVDVFLDETGGHEASQISLQIKKDQLQQIVSAFEEANFFGVSYGCGEFPTKAQDGTIIIIEVFDAGFTDISVETNGNSHAIEDNGVCGSTDYSFGKYCDLADTVEKIININIQELCGVQK